uniref:Putative ovule protein n=1 Tax=Solanum chacoense TaxID=4108 RepID=A0A0V0HGP8_SOLCH
MLGMPVDPIDPPKFKHKKIPRASGSPPVPLMHSPPRPISVRTNCTGIFPLVYQIGRTPKVTQSHLIGILPLMAEDFRRSTSMIIWQNLWRLYMLQKSKPEKQLQCGSKFRKRLC